MGRFAGKGKGYVNKYYKVISPKMFTFYRKIV